MNGHRNTRMKEKKRGTMIGTLVQWVPVRDTAMATRPDLIFRISDRKVSRRPYCPSPVRTKCAQWEGWDQRSLFISPVALS